MKQPAGIQRILLIALVLETICVTYALYIPLFIPTISVLHTLAGLVIAYGLLWMKPALPPISNPVFSFASNINRYRWLLMGIALFMLCRFCAQWMKDDPIDYHNADMLPIIKVMNQRFIAGNWSQVYDPIPEIWNGIKPIYLPAMWMPFGLPEALQIDVRWLTVLVFIIILGILLWAIDARRKNVWPLFLCIFLLFWWLFYDEKAGLFTFTEEGVVVLYYVLLAIALLKRNIWMICIAASLCVFSRYALVGWLPAMLLYFAYLKEWKNLFRFAFTGILFFLLLLLLPFGWKTVYSLIALPGSYIEFAKRIWQDAPQVFSGSLGWAKFFGPNHIMRLHYLLILLSFTVPFLSMFVALRWNKKFRIPVQNIPLAVLKLSLVIFFSLIDVPYLYLFYTSSFVSVVAIASVLSRENDRKSVA
ncbi:MAG: hypothetical protein V4539_00270 [Bacteroidota bacterium]